MNTLREAAADLSFVLASLCRSVLGDLTRANVCGDSSDGTRESMPLGYGSPRWTRLAREFIGGEIPSVSP